MNALFIGPKFYGYETEIKKELERIGWNVDYFPERMDGLNSLVHFISKGFSSANKINSVYEKYIWNCVKKKQYDFFLLIRGESLSVEFIKKLKRECVNGLSVYYSWDSEKNLPNMLKIIDVFDKRYTFDLADSERINNIEFLPLFFIDAYVEEELIAEKEWDIATVASFTPRRCNIISKLESEGFKTFYSLYMKPYLHYKERIVSKQFRPFDKYVTHNVMSSKDIMHVYRNSKAVLDVPSISQNGLSIRTLECLGSSMKLITTNEAVKRYDFYNQNNIFVINENDFKKDLLLSWLEIPYETLPIETVNRYSIHTWVDKLLE